MLAPNEAYSVSSFAALREVNALKSNMTKAQAEIVLSSFVAKGWLLKSRSVFLPTIRSSSPAYIFLDVVVTLCPHEHYWNCTNTSKRHTETNIFLSAQSVWR
jgi:hypothetical protein